MPTGWDGIQEWTQQHNCLSTDCVWETKIQNTNTREKKQINILYPATTAETNQTASPLVKPQGFTPGALKQ